MSAEREDGLARYSDALARLREAEQAAARTKDPADLARVIRARAAARRAWVELAPGHRPPLPGSRIGNR